MVGGYAITESISIAITIVNMIIREVCIVFIKMIGYHTQSGEISAIMTVIFIATFFNTGFLLLLTEANTQYTFLKFLPFTGPYTDLSENWYLDIGPSLVLTMLINSVYLWTSFASSFATKALGRCLDQGCTTYFCCKKDKTTKCKTVQQYVNLYSGPVYTMHFKYAAIMNTIFVTMLYAYALPLLWPIAAFTFINYYICERLLLAYWYQKPPVYDDKLNNAALAQMKWAPLFMLFFGYWIMGQQQIFDN